MAVSQICAILFQSVKYDVLLNILYNIYYIVKNNNKP
jgi:hypothetical protein